MAAVAIDLRSDTVTRPSPAMRRAMAEAPVGDDQYGEDPSVNGLEKRVSDLLGKEAALFVASGTMANQIALRVLAQPGDEVIVGGEAHVLWHETGAASALAGVQILPLGTSGLFDASAFRAAVKPRGHMVFPPTGVVVVENTHNRGGGVVFPQADADAVCAAAEELGIASYLDGARLFNAACASGTSPERLAAPFRLSSISLSKGLGCPVGSVLAGRAEDITKARRIRRLYGGAMRQAGILAGAGLFALNHNLVRLTEDHANAALFADTILAAPGIRLERSTVQTNIVLFYTEAPAAAVVARARDRGVLLSQFGAHAVRATTHMDVTRDDCLTAARTIVDLLQ